MLGWVIEAVMYRTEFRVANDGSLHENLLVEAKRV